MLQDLGTFESVSSIVKNAMIESLVHILSPKCRVDILRDAMEAKKQSRPYVITFCGVNGVGKSTNLAKVGIDEGKGYTLHEFSIFFKKFG